MATYVLVPGFWFGAWVWEEVTGPLRERGHDVRPVTLPGLAERAAEATPEVDVEAHIADLAGYLDRHDLRDVVLVAHSGGAWPVTGVADRHPERLRRVVYVDTGPPPDGMAQIDFEPDAEQETRDRVAAEGDGWRLPAPAFDPATDPAILAGLSDAQLRLMREHATPQPFRTATQALNRPATIPPMARAAIVCTFTSDQVRMLAGSGVAAFAPMAGAELHDLPTGHWPMLSRPADLAGLLDEIA